MNASLPPIWKDITELERSIQSLEEWAAKCATVETLELRMIIEQKIGQLQNRIQVVQQLIIKSN